MGAIQHRRNLIFKKCGQNDDASFDGEPPKTKRCEKSTSSYSLEFYLDCFEFFRSFPSDAIHDSLRFFYMQECVHWKR